MENNIYKNNFKKLSSTQLFPISRYTYVPNMDILSQTMSREWSYLDHLDWNLYMFIDNRLFVKYLFGKFVEIQVYHFFLSTSTHKSSPWQRNSFFEVYFIFFEFFEKFVKMAGMAIPWKRSIFSKLSMFLWNNQYFCTLKWFL